MPGTANITIIPSDNADIDVGTALAGGMQIVDAELDNISTSGIVRFDTNGAIQVDNVSSAISGQLFFDAGTSVDFLNNASTFSGGLRVQAGDVEFGVAVNAGGSAQINAISNSDLYLRAAPGAGMHISGLELERLTATSLLATTSGTGNIYVTGISAANSNNISGTTTLRAQNSGSVNFQTTDSTFNALTAQGASGVLVDGITLTTDTGALNLNGDYDNAVDAGDGVLLNNGVTLNSQGLLTLASTNSNDAISANNTLALNAVDITINKTLNAAGQTISISTIDGGSIGVGDTAGNMTLSPTELSRHSISPLKYYNNGFWYRCR